MTDRPLLTNETRARVKKLGEPIALFLGRLGLTPNALTLLGFGITVIAAVLAGAELWLAAGIVVFVGGVFDMFDGTLARATGRVSRLGAFMDSVFDRWGESVVYLGIVVGCGQAGFHLGAYLAAAAMGAAFMVSYARARSEGLGFTAGAGMAEVGLAPREVRIVILTVGLLAAGLIGGVGGGVPGSATTTGEIALAAALGAVAVLATLTVIQRIVHVYRLASREAGTSQGAR